ncbi:MAG: cupredoxin family copper-binding protein [Amylibacter sp.]
MQKINRRDVLINSVAAYAVTGLNLAQAYATPAAYTITIHKFKFEPDHIDVHVGDTITWINQDLAPHTATADTNDWGTKMLEKGQSKSLLVSESMTGDYYCQFHPNMKGTITIK